MNRKTDIVVVGSGIAGMTAALTAAQSGKKVTLLTHGVGSLAISSGSIDVLGYVNGKAVADPFAAMQIRFARHRHNLNVAEVTVPADSAHTVKAEALDCAVTKVISRTVIAACYRIG